MPIAVFVAIKDLLGERLLTLCLVLSVMAVLIPIMLLTSVKIGFIDRLRQDFISDPSFREIRPKSAILRSEAFFSDLGGWEGVRYVLPSVMLTPRDVDFRTTSAKPFRGRARLVPTTFEDPIFQQAFVGVPPLGSTVALSEDLAKDAGVALGDGFTLLVSRIENDRSSIVSIEATIVGILPAERASLPTIYVAPEIDLQVEDFRSGVAVVERGWKGVSTDPNLTYDALAVRMPETLGETRLAELRIRVGASSSEVLDAGAVMELAVGESNSMAPIQADEKYLVLRNKERGYAFRDLGEANAVLRNEQATAFGIAAALPANVLGASLRLVGFYEGFMADDAEGVFDKIASRGRDFSLNNKIALPASLRPAWEEVSSPTAVEVTIDLPESSATRVLAMPLEVVGFVPGNDAVVSGGVLAMVRRGQDVEIAYDPLGQTLVEKSSGYRGFRLVGETLEDIPLLVERFEAAGVEVRARSDAILKLQRLERSLNILVGVVAFVALAGGFAILTASFFANVKRKQVDYATMRLIGMAKSDVFQIPLTQAILISFAGYGISVAVYLFMSMLLNEYIAKELNFDGRLSVLYFSHFTYIGFFVVGGAAVASITASREATRIDPAQALRGA